MSHATYAGVQKANESPRDLEIRVIAHVTRDLLEANKPDSDPMTRIRALNGNIRLWSLLIEALSHPANALPDKLKASYISLGIFSRRTSLAALTAARDLSTLIQINTDVLDALEQQRQTRIAA